LAVFWAIVVMSMAVGGWFLWLQERVKLHGEEARSAEALAMAHSGVAMALNPQVERYSSLLSMEVGPQLGFRVQVEGEGGRLNLPFLLTGEDPQRIGFFKQWLEYVIGLKGNEIDRLVDCLLDYVDADNLARLNGQEDKGDYHPPNRMILDLDELKRVPGLEPLLSYPGWKDLLTMDSAGHLDLLEASEQVLGILPGFGPAEVMRLGQLRAGPDGVWRTQDDPKFTGVDQVRMALGMDAKRWALIQGLASANDRTLRIKSEGHSGKVVRQVQVVVRKGGGTPQIRSWIE
jgi:hypothetical protein